MVKIDKPNRTAKTSRPDFVGLYELTIHALSFPGKMMFLHLLLN
jgi:hypothetical protein